MDIMDNILYRISDFVSQFKAPPIIFAALHTTRTQNSPTPFLTVSFQESGSYEKYTFGNKIVKHPVNHIAVSSTYHGANSFSPSKDYKRWVISIRINDTADFADVKKEPFFISKPVNSPGNVINMFRKVISFYPPINNLTALHLKASYLELLAGIIMETGTRESTTAFSQEVADALKFINSCFNKPDLSLSDIASSCNLSKRQLDRKFMAELSASPMKHLRRRRMEHAEYLLQNSSLRINEIAAETGYPDPLHFSRVFKNETGISPSAFRIKKR